MVNEVFRDGKEVKIILDGVYNHLNSLLVVRTCTNSLDIFDFTQEEVKQFKHQNSSIKSGNQILKMMSFLNQTSFGIAYSLNPAQLFNKFTVESSLLFKK